MLAAYYQIVAQVYGAGTYGQSTYQGAAGSSGGLTNTGIAISSILTLAALILLATLVVRLWRRPGRQTTLATARDSTLDDKPIEQMTGD